MRAVVGLGGNLGDRRAMLVEARARIAAVASIADSSHIYETAPVGPPQPDYFNAAVLVDTALSPRELLLELLAIERAMGRVRDVRWGPRTIDLDVLWIDGVSVNEPDLVVPHPRLHERAFALVPLLGVAPDARDPSGARYADLAIDRAGVRDVGMLDG